MAKYLEADSHSHYESRQYMCRPDFETFYYVTRKPRTAALIQHDFYEIIFFRQGEVAYEINGICYDLIPCDILMIPPEILSRPIFRRESTYKRMILWISPAFMDSIDPDGTLRQAFYYHDAEGRPVYLLRGSNARIFTMFETQLSEGGGKAYYDQMAKAQIIRILILINRAMESSGDKDSDSPTTQYEIVLRAATYINKNIASDLALDTVADALFVSKFHLSRLFRQYMHITYHQYVTEHRLISARRLINEGYPLHEVSKKCGYASYSTFYRAFKSYYHTSPREWAKHDNREILPVTTDGAKHTQ